MGAIQQLVSSFGGSSPITVVAHTGVAGSTDSGTTTGIDTSGASLLVVAVSYADTGGDVVVTDSKSNVWTAGTKQVTNNIANRLFWTTSAPIVGSAHTFTETLTAGTGSIAVIAFRNTFVGAVDGQNGATSAGVSVGTLQPGTLTPSAINSVVVTSVTYFSPGGAAATINSGFTVSDSPASAAAFGCGFAYLIQTAAVAVNPTWTISASTPSSATIAAFKHS